MTPQTIRAARAGLGWTQAQLAAEAGLHRNAIAYWERGTGKNLGAATAAVSIRQAFARHGVTIHSQAVTFTADQ